MEAKAFPFEGSTGLKPLPCWVRETILRGRYIVEILQAKIRGVGGVHRLVRII